MGYFKASLFVIILVIAGCATQRDFGPRTLIGHFTYLEKDMFYCGTLSLGSKGIFIVDGSGKEIEISVPCIEMQFAKNRPAIQTPIQIGMNYEIVVSRKKPTQDFMTPNIHQKNPLILQEFSLRN